MNSIFGCIQNEHFYLAYISYKIFHIYLYDQLISISDEVVCWMGQKKILEGEILQYPSMEEGK